MEKIEAVILDMDGVMFEEPSSWRKVHKHFKVKDNIEDLDAYLRLKITDNELMERTIAKWPACLHISKIEEILSGCKMMKGTKKTIKELKNRGLLIGIVSCGLDLLAQRIGKELGLNPDYILAEGLETDEDGNLTGLGISRVEILKKDEALIRLTEKMGVPLKRVAVVGNTKYDAPMMRIAALGIAFNPGDEEVKKAANAVVKSKNLSKILKYI